MSKEKNNMVYSPEKKRNIVMKKKHFMASSPGNMCVCDIDPFPIIFHHIQHTTGFNIHCRVKNMAGGTISDSIQIGGKIVNCQAY